MHRIDGALRWQPAIMEADQPEDCLEALYAAGCDPEAWTGAMALVARFLGGDAGWLAEWPRSGPTSRAVLTETRGERLVLPLTPANRGAVYAAEIIRARRRGGFSEADLTRAAGIQSHLARAFSLGRKAASERRLSGDLSAALDLLPSGVFMLDRNRVVRHANRAANAITRDGAALILAGGRLCAREPQADGMLQSLLRCAGALESGGTLMIDCADRRLAISVSAAPTPATPASVFEDLPSIIVCASDPAATVTLGEPQLQTLFGLTPAEARVAQAMFEGHSPRQASQRLGVSVNTVRSQLQQIYEKTGVNRQSALISTLMQAVGAPAAPPTAAAP